MKTKLSALATLAILVGLANGFAFANPIDFTMTSLHVAINSFDIDFGSGPVPTGPISVNLDPSANPAAQVLTLDFAAGTVFFSADLVLDSPLIDFLGGPLPKLHVIETASDLTGTLSSYHFVSTGGGVITGNPIFAGWQVLDGNDTEGTTKPVHTTNGTYYHTTDELLDEYLVIPPNGTEGTFNTTGGGEYHSTSGPYNADIPEPSTASLLLVPALMLLSRVFRR